MFRKSIKHVNQVHAELVTILNDNRFKLINRVYLERLKKAQKQVNELQQTLTLLQYSGADFEKRPVFIIRLYRFFFK